MRFIDNQAKVQFEQFDSDDELATTGLSIVDGQILQQKLSDVAIFTKARGEGGYSYI